MNNEFKGTNGRVKPGMEMIYSRRPLITLDTRLRDIPQDWLRYIEPRIVRAGFLPCWQDTYIPCGTGGVPVIRVDGRVQVLQRFAASIFWDFPNNLRVKMMCRNRSCVNPHHMYICEPLTEPPHLPTQGL